MLANIASLSASVALGVIRNYLHPAGHVNHVTHPAVTAELYHILTCQRRVSCPTHVCVTLGHI